MSENKSISHEPHTIRCHTVAQGGFKHLNYVRDVPPLVVEERLDLTSDTAAPTPSEMLLAALGSCLGARIHANAAAANIVVRALALDIRSRISSSTMWEPHGTAPGPIGFETISVSVQMDADSSPEALRALIAHALLWSPVANTLHDPVDLDVALGRIADATPPR